MSDISLFACQAYPSFGFKMSQLFPECGRGQESGCSRCVNNRCSILWNTGKRVIGFPLGYAPGVLVGDVAKVPCHLSASNQVLQAGVTLQICPLATFSFLIKIWLATTSRQLGILAQTKLLYSKSLSCQSSKCLSPMQNLQNKEKEEGEGEEEKLVLQKLRVKQYC